MQNLLVTVFGGSGFLGQRIVQTLAEAGHEVRVAARHPEKLRVAAELEAHILPTPVDIRDERAVANAVRGADAVVNAVALWVERGSLTFEAIHVDGAERIARCAAAAKVAQLVHVSGLGVSEHSPSPFIRARARGEKVVHALYPDAAIVRPSLMFGRDDAFLSSLELASRFPIIPLFGRGRTRLQPAAVDDVAAAIGALCEQPAANDVFQLGGAQVLSYREAVETVLEHRARRAALMPVPFSLWKLGTIALSVLPDPPLTRDQITLLEHDNVVESGASGFASLGIKPQRFDSALDACLGSRRER